MIAAVAVAASSFFSVPSSSTSASAKASRGIPDSLGVRSIVAKPASSSGGMQAKANARAIPKINDTSSVGLQTDVEEDAASTAQRTSYNQLPDWSMLLAAIRTIFSAAEKRWTLLDSKMRRPDAVADCSGIGKMVENGLVYRQNFSIRSYEIGADQKASIEALMNHFQVIRDRRAFWHAKFISILSRAFRFIITKSSPFRIDLQETSLNHCKCIGLMHGGFGCTPEMTRRNLIWVVTKMLVHVERYPLWWVPAFQYHYLHSPSIFYYCCRCCNCQGSSLCTLFFPFKKVAR